MGNVVIDFSKTKLNISEIFNRINQYDVYCKYLGFSPKLGVVFSSPFRNDKNPSFCIYPTKSGNIRYKDFGTGENGSVTDFLKKILNTSSLSDIEIQLSKDFGLTSRRKIVKDIASFDNYNYKNIERQSKSNLYYRSRLFTNTDIKYWNSYGVSLDTLNKFDIKSCDELLIHYKDRCRSYNYTVNNPMYIFILDKGIFKIYRPYGKRGKDKWFSNCSRYDIQGLKHLPSKIDQCIITKSMKDIVVLYELGYNAIAPQSEGSWMSNKQLDYIYAISNRDPIVFYDNDEAGMKASEKIVKNYNINRIYIPEKYIEYNIKDVSDFVKKYGKKETKKLLKELIN